MQIILLNYNTTGEKLAIRACGVCVGTGGTLKGFKKAVESGHLSVLEHLNMTFLIEGISRACAQQLTRYRLNKPTMESQRYVNISENPVVTPKTILDNKDALYIYNKLITESKESYNTLVELGIPIEDARMVTTQAETTKLLVTIDCRAFIHECEERLCSMAQLEIRTLFKQMKECIKDVYPTVYSYCKPKCAYSKCIETRPCSRKGNLTKQEQSIEAKWRG